MKGTSKPLRTATYVLRFTEEEKRELEAKVARAAAEGQVPLTLAHALRMGAKTYLDELLAKVHGPEEVRRDDGLAT